MSALDRNGCQLMLATAVRVGDALDLEGDIYADPCHGGTPNHLNSYEFELAEVTETERETADCVRIGGPGFCVGFPADHRLKVRRPMESSVC